jgi:hypothetical protein
MLPSPLWSARSGESGADQSGTRPEPSSLELNTPQVLGQLPPQWREDHRPQHIERADNTTRKDHDTWVKQSNRARERRAECPH